MYNPYESYQKNAVNTATPGELTLMLYNGCIKNLRVAKNAMESQNYSIRNESIQKAQQIINELIVTLNRDIPISNQLAALYDYMNRRLVEANIKNDVEVVTEIEGLLVELADSWKEALKQLRQQSVYKGSSI